MSVVCGWGSTHINWSRIEAIIMSGTSILQKVTARLWYSCLVSIIASSIKRISLVITTFVWVSWKSSINAPGLSIFKMHLDLIICFNFGSALKWSDSCTRWLFWGSVQLKHSITNVSLFLQIPFLALHSGMIKQISVIMSQLLIIFTCRPYISHNHLNSQLLVSSSLFSSSSESAFLSLVLGCLWGLLCSYYLVIITIPTQIFNKGWKYTRYLGSGRMLCCSVYAKHSVNYGRVIGLETLIKVWSKC